MSIRTRPTRGAATRRTSCSIKRRRITLLILRTSPRDGSWRPSTVRRCRTSSSSATAASRVASSLPCGDFVTSQTNNVVNRNKRKSLICRCRIDESQSRARSSLEFVPALQHAFSIRGLGSLSQARFNCAASSRPNPCSNSARRFASTAARV